MSWRHHGLRQSEVGSPTKYRIDQIRLNSNFAWNSYRCAFGDSRPIITKFGTRHDSRTVVTCTKFRYDRPTIIEIRGARIFSKFWIRSNLSIRYLVGQAPGVLWGMGRCIVGFVRLLYFLDIWRTSLKTIACRFDTVFFELRDPKHTCEISQKFAAS